MSLIKDRAIVLRRLDYSETSQVVAMLTREHGQQRLIAKGIKRGTKQRVAVGLDLLEMGEVVFSRRPGKEGVLAPISEWHQQDHFRHLRENLPQCYAAQYAAEITSHLTETQDPHPHLFDGLLHLLRQLDTSPVLAALVRYLWLLLNEIGLRPELARCLNCNRSVRDDAVLYFSSRQGGAICCDCEPAMVEKRRIDSTTARALAGQTWEDATEAEPIFELLDYHLREIMSRPAKLSPLLRKALGMPARS